MIKRLIIGFLLCLPLLSFSHPVHISVCDIHYNSDSNTFQVSIRLFSDDLELGIRKSLKDEVLDIGFKTESSITDSLIEQYLLANFQVFIEDSLYIPTFIGKESEGMSVWCYLEMKVPSQLNQFHIKNALLDKRFEDQKNMVHFHHLGNVDSKVFDKDRRKQTIRITNQ